VRGTNLGVSSREFFSVATAGFAVIVAAGDWPPVKTPGTKTRLKTPIYKHRMRGDPDFEQLVNEHHAPLYRFAISLCRNESEAGDLVQETFYLWATKGHQLLNPGKVKSWLFTTLHREFLAKRRRLVRFPHHDLAEVEAELPETPPTLPERLDWELLGQCLARVESPFQSPVALFYLEDYSYNEIAEILEVPLGTVKSRIARGIAQLQKMLSEPPIPGPSNQPRPT
jgi:RNA polymerase sigma factor (sigma-70 family)